MENVNLNGILPERESERERDRERVRRSEGGREGGRKGGKQANSLIHTRCQRAREGEGKIQRGAWTGRQGERESEERESETEKNGTMDLRKESSSENEKGLGICRNRISSEDKKQMIGNTKVGKIRGRGEKGKVGVRAVGRREEIEAKSASDVHEGSPGPAKRRK